MRRPGGYLIATGPEGPAREADTFTCSHSGRVVIVKPFCDPADMGGRCTICGGLIAKEEVGKGCDVLERKLLRWEARKSYEAA